MPEIIDLESSTGGLADDGFDTDDEYEQLRAQFEQSKAKLEAAKARRANKRRKTNHVAFRSLTDDQKAKLVEIKDPNDRGLQRLLWELGCDFALFDHQFLGVRAIAGVAQDFPGDHKRRLEALKNARPRRPNDPGLIMADVMGLGKTVQAVAAMVLSNAIAASLNKTKLPSLICCPNDAVLDQWKSHLKQAGVSERKIIMLKTKRPDFLPKDDIFYLCTRYNLMSEARFIFEKLPELKKDASDNRPPNEPSPLFARASLKTLDVLKNQYESNKSDFKTRKKNRYNDVNGEKMKPHEVVTEYLAKAKQNMVEDDMIFRSVILDEAHFLKNLPRYWSLCAALIGLHSGRFIPMTGTPYNNSCQDIATLIAFIDPSHSSSKLKWWKKVTEQGQAQAIKEYLSNWTSQFVLRREKDVIASHLPQKIIRKDTIMEHDLEEYEKFEKKIMSVLQQIIKLSNGVSESTIALEKELRKMLAVALCMQMALIHPLLPKGGRQLSILFSPSLCNNAAVKKKLENKNTCVCCERKNKLVVTKGASATMNDLDDFEDNDDDIFGYEDVDDDDRFSNMPKGRGKIVPINKEYCEFAKRGIRHFACESCLKKLVDNGGKCPQCENLLSRISNASATSEENNSIPSGEGGIYRREVFGGFRPSGKLETIVSNFMTKVPSSDKIILASQFKGSLDLLEAMFHAKNIEVARFDGDVPSGERKDVLQDFKRSLSCRVLLMTIQTGGTGLNIVEANHVWFVDRYWNPMVLEQCEDRCYRIGQKKDVHVAYHDSHLTIDDAMRFINEAKSTNAAIVLSDSIVLSSGSIKFKDLSGFLGKALSALRAARGSCAEVSADRILASVISNIPRNEQPPLAHPSQNKTDYMHPETGATNVDGTEGAPIDIDAIDSDGHANQEYGVTRTQQPVFPYRVTRIQQPPLAHSWQNRFGWGFSAGATNVDGAEPPPVLSHCGRFGGF